MLLWHITLSREFACMQPFSVHAEAGVRPTPNRCFVVAAPFFGSVYKGCPENTSTCMAGGRGREGGQGGF